MIDNIVRKLHSMVSVLDEKVSKKDTDKKNMTLALDYKQERKSTAHIGTKFLYLWP
jgi:hypothetical protein